MYVGFTPNLPTSTAIFKTLIALKTRNGILISPHPRAKRSTIEAARIVLAPVLAEFHARVAARPSVREAIALEQAK